MNWLLYELGEYVTVQDQFTDNKGQRIHYLDSDPTGEKSGVPIVFIPGALGRAENFRAEIDTLAADRRCIAVSLRGRGQSDAPEAGYRLEHHTGDLEAVIKALHLRGFCLMGYSVGVPVVLEYASHYPEQLAGLILGDYPPRWPAFSLDWVEKTLGDLTEGVNRETVWALHQDSHPVELWDRLGRIECPTLVLRGGKKDSLLSADDSQRMLQHLPNALAVVFEESGHDLSQPNPARFTGTLRAFLAQLDSLA